MDFWSMEKWIVLREAWVKMGLFVFEVVFWV